MFGWAASNWSMTLNQAAFSPTSNCSQDIRLSVILPLLLLLPDELLLLLLPLLLPQADRIEAPAPAARTPPESWKKLRRLSGLGTGSTFASLRASPFISFLCPVMGGYGSPVPRRLLVRYLFGEVAGPGWADRPRVVENQVK